MPAPKAKTPVRRRTQEERRRETRRRLVDATIAVIAERGIAHTATADITGRAGVSWGAAQHLFGSKDELLRQVVEEVSKDLIARLDAAALWPRGLEARVRAVVEAMWAICGSPGFLAMMDVIRGTRVEPDLHPKIVADQARVQVRIENLWLKIFADLRAPRRAILDTCNLVYLSLIALAARKNYLYPDTDVEGMIRAVTVSAANLLSSPTTGMRRRS